ncbi:nucleotidyltransferase family protein [Collinsella ihumii]|uniref:nucleotidyltransferase family protein n=1 Tax=Collinsella ihumii TaxID=1720204 RepID=UPI000B1788DB|nr:nucleotidyltransferase domain-containing protein [Collinsella ihumii]
MESAQERSARIAEIARIATAACSAHPIVKKLYLFGSRARGDFRPDSDYDFYAVLDYSIKPLTAAYLAAIEALEAAFESHVDFVSGEVWPARDQTLKEEIERDKELVYDRDAQ